MIRKSTFVLALIFFVLALGACAKKEEPQQQAQEATPAAPAAPAVTPGEMVLIPAGEYIIGTNEKQDPTDKTKPNFAYPEHKVKLKAFYIDKYEVTGAEYLDFSIKTQYEPEGAAEGKTWRTFFDQTKPNNPVVYITYKDAESYCKSLGKRLPTEEEWEAAGRGPNGNRFPWGNQWEDNKANTAEAGYRVPVEIGKFDDVSSFGVHDLLGNVQEWTSSSFKPYPGSNAGGFNPQYKVVRGLSSRYQGVKLLGLYTRSAYVPNFLADFGCRCAKDASPEEAGKGTPAK